jgi:hypothetical protein
MRAAFLLVTLIALGICSTSSGGGAAGSLSVMVNPAVNLSPVGLNFGNQALQSSSSPQSVTLTNTGSAALTILSIAVSGDFTQTNNCGTSVAVGNSCTINVVFTPTRSGTRSGTLSISDNAPGSPQSATLSGTGGAPASAVSLTPAGLAFLSQDVGATSAAQSITLTDSATGTLTITSLAITGTNASDFAQSNTCGNSVAAGATFTIGVTFRPSASGARTATLSVADNASGSPQTVSLSGTGIAPAVSFSPTTLSFLSQPVGTTSTTQTITLANRGNVTLSITSLAITGTNASDFAQTNSCGNSVGAGATCTIGVTFTPSASGARTATLSVADNASGSPQTVSLSGTGTAPGASVSPTSLSFGSRSVATTTTPQTITLANSGNATLTITSLAVTGTNASDFAQTNNCGNSVAAGANCTIRVTFTPSARGARTATLSVVDNASAGPQTVSLSGTGTPQAAENAIAPAVSLSATNLSFASQSVGTTSTAQTITLANSGNVTLSITSFAVTGTNATDFAQTTSCGNSVAAGANCTIGVTFTPSATGVRTATLNVADSASGSPQTVSLSGTGIAPAVRLSPNNLSFVSQPVGATSTTQTITLANSGSATLTITSLAVTGTNASDFVETHLCGSSIAAGAYCNIVVLFRPSAAGVRTAALSVTDNAKGSPQTVSLSGTGSHDVILSWTASATPGVIGYNVYRGTTSSGESSTPLNPTPIDGTTYLDQNVTPGATYYYYVTALAANGVTQSANSNEAAATVPTP